MKLESQIKKPPRDKSFLVFLVFFAFLWVAIPVAAYYDGKAEGRREAELRTITHDSVLSGISTGDTGTVVEQPKEAHRYYDGCNWHTCVGDSCTETLRGCVGNTPAWYEVSLDEWSTEPLIIEQPETDVTLSIWSREYQRIHISAPGYTCKRDGKGWVCERGER